MLLFVSDERSFSPNWDVSIFLLSFDCSKSKQALYYCCLYPTILYTNDVPSHLHHFESPKYLHTNLSTCKDGSEPEDGLEPEGMKERRSMIYLSPTIY